MRLEFPGALILWLLCDLANGFSQSLAKQGRTQPASTSQRYVSIGLGPDQTDEEEKKELVAGVDYEVPDHEAYRKSRRSKLDEKCDEWFASLLGTEKDKGVLGSLADETRKILLTPVELVNDVSTKAFSKKNLFIFRLTICTSINAHHAGTKTI